MILGWSAAILTINYLRVPGLAKTNIDPTFISVFTGTLATFGVATSKKNGDSPKGTTCKYMQTEGKKVMQKIVNAIAIFGGVVALGVVGLGGYVFIRGCNH